MAKHTRGAAPGVGAQPHGQAAASQVQAPLPATGGVVDGTRGGGKPGKSVKPGKRKRGGVRNIISTLLIVAGVALLLVAGGMYAYQQWRYREQDKVNADLATHVTIDDAAATQERTCPITVDWEALRAINDEVVGWLYIPGTTINYAVYRHADNDYYLHHSAEGDWTVGGQLFLDADNLPPGMRDGQSLIYGHHLNNGTMFEQIAAMDEQESFDAITSIWYVTEEQAFELVPVFMYDTDRDDVEARTTFFATADDVRTFMAARLTGAMTRRDDAEAVVAHAEHFLTLSTCVYYSNYARGHGRGLVVCVPVDELPASASTEVAS